ncbi:hypothetical protein L914_08699, partial [Phytophthora nicotianae]
MVIAFGLARGGMAAHWHSDRTVGGSQLRKVGRIGTNFMAKAGCDVVPPGPGDGDGGGGGSNDDSDYSIAAKTMTTPVPMTSVDDDQQRRHGRGD